MRGSVSLLTLVATAALAGCSGGPPDRERGDNLTASDTAAMEAGPGVAPTAAPGVAFNYRYAFRMQGDRIAETQERHAAACEKLGLDRCRITGLRYRLIGERDVEAMLAFSLDPAIARAFGKQGIDAVAEADGMLVDSEISGEDVGSRITAADRDRAGVREDLAELDRRLAQPGLRPAERAELQAQADRLRTQLRAIGAAQNDRREALATTPMVFQYGSGDVAPGLGGRPSVMRALENAANNFLRGVSMLLVIVVTLLPWAVAVGLAVWLWRLLARRFGWRLPAAAEGAA